MTKERPFIHPFETPIGKYIYDVNTGKVIKVEPDVYEYLVLQDDGELDEKNAQQNTLEKIENLKERGLLKSNRVKRTEHPYTKMVPYLLQNKMGNIILQVTQNCNLRCEYCVYSGGYKTRVHSNKRMSFDIAKKAIDYLVKHSKEMNTIYIGFYGGEPLLEFELIKKCVSYVKEVAYGKKVFFAMTTNGTLLKDEVVDYLIEQDFLLTISIDGPREIHNRSRHFADTDVGSYDVMLSNLQKIKQKSSKYYSTHVRFSTVLLAENGFNCVDRYFKEDELFADSSFYASLVSDFFSKKKRIVSDVFIQEQQYEVFKSYLYCIGRIPKKAVSVLLKGNIEYLNRFIKRTKDNSRQHIPETWHRGGPCIPGLNRLFVTADGELLPCEKVCEIAEISKLGEIETGIDIEKAKELLNIGKLTELQCQNCWAYMECTSCIRICDDNKDNVYKRICSECERVRRNFEDILKDYTVLMEFMNKK